MQGKITIFGVRLASERACTICPNMEHAQGVIDDLVRACTGEEPWVNPPDEVWMMVGWPSLSSKVGDREWTKGVRVYPPTSLRYR